MEAVRENIVQEASNARLWRGAELYTADGGSQSGPRAWQRASSEKSLSPDIGLPFLQSPRPPTLAIYCHSLGWRSDFQGWRHGSRG